MRNPFAFGRRWHWLPITTGPAYWANGTAHMPVSAQIRRWHPLFWLFVAGLVMKHVRRRISVGRAR